MIPFNLENETHSHNSGQSKSLWMEKKLPLFSSLKKDLEVDVCIVGAGIAGLTCAYTLTKQGKSVAVIEQGTIGGGQTGRTTAHLAWVLDDRFEELERLFGAEGSRLAAESHLAAIDYIEKIVLEEQLECDFERLDGYLFVPQGGSIKVLDQEFYAIQKIGFDVHRIPKAPFKSFDTGPCLQFPGQAQFHILNYLQGLVDAIKTQGGEIFTHTHASSFVDGSPCIVHTESGLKIASQSVIVATCTPVNNRFFMHTKQAPYRTYVVAASIPKGSVPKGLYWDTLDPYHYVRLQKNSSDSHSEWLIVGGEDHKTGQGPEVQNQYQRLEAWTRARFPMTKQFEYRWSGQVYEPIDLLAFIGRNPGNENIYIATGDSGNGMTHGTIAGILLPDLIAGKPNPWKKLYEPSRKTLSAAFTYMHENLNALIQYKDWLTPGETRAVELLGLDEGMILREGLKKLAVYKDIQGKVHIHSALCPHLAGCVRWNQGEKSWECPVHGSRFDGCGHVLVGPAIKDLCPHSKKP